MFSLFTGNVTPYPAVKVLSAKDVRICGICGKSCRNSSFLAQHLKLHYNMRKLRQMDQEDEQHEGGRKLSHSSVRLSVEVDRVNANANDCETIDSHARTNVGTNFHDRENGRTKRNRTGKRLPNGLLIDSDDRSDQSSSSEDNSADDTISVSEIEQTGKIKYFYKCKHCGKRFTTRSLQRRHKQLEHTSDANNNKQKKSQKKVLKHTGPRPKPTSKNHIVNKVIIEDINCNGKHYCIKCDKHFSHRRIRDLHVKSNCCSENNVVSQMGCTSKECNKSSAPIKKSVHHSHTKSDIVKNAISLTRKRQKNALNGKIIVKSNKMIVVLNGKDEKVWRCLRCGFTCQEKRILDMHTKHHEGVSFPYICMQCNKAYSEPGKFQAHELSHTGDKRVKCTDQTCNGRFYSTESMKAHYRIVHAGKKRYRPKTCRVCGLKLNSSNHSSHTEHLLQVHKTILSYRCKFCELNFVSQPQMVTHQASHPSLRCRFCKRIMSSKTAHYKHINMHHRKQVPVYVDYNRETEEKMSKKIYKHSTSKPFKCSLCPRSFLKPFHLRLHCIANHRRKYTCVTCRVTFYKKSSLLLHRMANQNNKNHKRSIHDKHCCPYCLRMVSGWWFLYRHCILHSHQWALYSCRFCRASFTMSNSLKGHLRKNHSQQNPFKCFICNVTFNTNASLGKHLQRFEHGAQPKCGSCGEQFLSARDHTHHCTYDCKCINRRKNTNQPFQENT